MVKLSADHIKGETITLDAASKDVHVLGPDLVLTDCEVHCDVDARGLIVAGLKMQGGIWRQNQKFSAADFSAAHFESVTFHGTFEGVVFGDWDDPGKASVKGCNFSDCTLDDIRFLHQMPSDNALPPWPAFAIRQPDNAMDHVAAQNWPQKIALDFNIMTDQSPECVMVVSDAAAIAKRAGTTTDELRDMLAGLPGLVIA